MDKRKIGKVLLIVAAVFGVAAFWFVLPIPQDQAYHNFTDRVDLLGIPNFWNVVTNVPFFIVGLKGLYKSKQISNSKIQHYIFFSGVALVSFGSGYYHWNPNDQTLLWDRLPMTIAFMALFSQIIGEFVNESLGKRLLIPLLLIGLVSVGYWIIFNDLRTYVLVQFYPMLAIPIILILFESEINRSRGYWLLLLAYFIAKLFEHFDREVLDILSVISGHSLKHIIAAIGIYIFIKIQSEHLIRETK